MPSNRDPDLLIVNRPQLEAWLADAAFNAYFGFRLRTFGSGECTVEAPYRAEFERSGGTICGPIFMAAADVATSLAVTTLRGPEEVWVTADLKTSFLRAARREPVVCTGRILRIGRHLAYAVAECTRPDGTVLTHHTVIYAHVSERGRDAAMFEPVTDRTENDRSSI